MPGSSCKGLIWNFNHAADELPDEHEVAENDVPEAGEEPPEDGSNVVSVDFTRKK